MKEDFEKVSQILGSSTDQVIEIMSGLIPLKAISPKIGGKGESDRAKFVDGLLKSWGFQTKIYEYTDETGAKRPNIVTSFGNAGRTIWFVPHMDTVAEGERSLWHTDPFVATVDGGRIYGRGTNDDGQGLVASLLAIKALKDASTQPRFNFGLALVSDEEMGSEYGMKRLLADNVFVSGDMFVVPDFWSPDGNIVEIGEKGVLWLKITITGAQVHASTPEEGTNAFRYLAKFLLKADELLHSKYSAENPVFRPQASTFEPTKHEKNVDSVNIIPGTETFYIDCRILPQYRPDDVITDVKALASAPEFKDVTISVEVEQRDDPVPNTSPDSELVHMMELALRKLRDVVPENLGIGGGTEASFIRKAGMQAVAYGTNDQTAHTPNEYVAIDNLLADAKLYAYVVL